MSASIYPPAELTIYDPGNVPEVWVDGLAYYQEENGLVRTGFYVLEPVLPIVGDLTMKPENIARLCFRFRCTVTMQRKMKEQATAVQKLVDDTTSLATIGMLLS